MFWVDETGQHGLVAAIEDQAFTKWRPDGTYATNAKGDEVYAGNMNTSIIISVHSAKDDFGDHAALVCANYNFDSFGDWYLPSKEELNLMWQNKETINTTAIANGGSAFTNAYYWSSTEYDDQLAWIQFFFNGNQFENPKYGDNWDRAVRAF